MSRQRRLNSGIADAMRGTRPTGPWVSPTAKFSHRYAMKKQELPKPIVWPLSIKKTGKAVPTNIRRNLAF